MQSDSLDVARPGIWPWLIGLAALLTLAICVTGKLRTIQNSILGAAVSVVASANAARVDVNVSGRDLTLSGAIDSNLDRDTFIGAFNRIEGVRVVHDELQEFNPREQARLDRQQFRQQLSTIDSASIEFQPGSAELSLSSEAVLLQLASLLRSDPGRQIKVAGHTDNSGGAAGNLELSRQRAQAVADFLTARGILESQLFVQGFGDTRPAFSNESAEGRAANRRIEFVFMR